MEALWKIERSLWLDDVEACAAHLADECLMAFGPTGIMQKADIIEALKAAPRWSSVAMSEQTVITPGDSVAIIVAYKAEGRRNDDPPYRALCTSTYLVLDGALKLAQHQQTPL